jgi:hypothetical protein
MELPFPVSPFPFLGRWSPATLRHRNCNILATSPPRRSRTIPGHSRNEPWPRFPPQLKLKPSSSPTGELASVFLLRCQALPPSPPSVSRTPPGHSAAQPSPSGSLFLLRMSSAQPCSGRKTTKLTSLYIHLYIYTFLKFKNLLQIKYSCEKYKINFVGILSYRTTFFI